LNSLKTLWGAGQPTVGLWHRLGTPQAVEIVGRSGFDWICVDAQHGFIDETEVRMMLTGLANASCPSIVRTSWHDPGSAMRALDAGAYGVLFPSIDDAQQAATAIGACRYPPAGYRSWAALGLGNDRPASANDAICCGLMIETSAALRNLDEILDVAGLDFAFVGPDDLAVSLGYEPTTEPNEPAVLRAIERVRVGCLERGLPAGIYCGTTERVRHWAQAGFRILAATSDTALLAQGASAAARSASDALGSL
jgi:4-hydroxy-2-oxoheptanedioate aldolase